MKSVSQTQTHNQPTCGEHLLPQVQEAIERVLTTAATALARPTGFLQRQGKLSGADYARLVVLGWLQNPAASLEALVQFGADLDIELSAQGRDQRLDERGAAFLQALFEVALGQVVQADPVAVPLWERFSAVILEDSTVVRLPDELACLLRGSGGHHQGEGLQSALKLHVRDRGFTDLDRWIEEVAGEQDVLSYLRPDLKLFDPEGRPLDLLGRLSQEEASRGECQVLVAERQRLAMRLLWSRVPEEIAAGRRERLQREAQTHGRVCSGRVMSLASWSLVLTTVSQQRLSLPEALVLLRLRWQIELLFKLWKQEGLLDEWRSQRAGRIRCELFARLIGLLLQHWPLIVSCWHEPHRSLLKASKAVRSHGVLLALALIGVLEFSLALSRTQQAAQRGARLNRRCHAPSTSQQLEEGLAWPSTPRKRRKPR
jgi:Transposase DDE domain